jgi:nascent polypeptide-associated complex subunit alpha
MNPKQMKAAMRRMGIQQDEVEGVEEAIIRTKDKEIVFRRPDVMSITAQGQVTYQIVGRPEERPRTTAGEAAGEGEGEDVEAAAPAPAAKYSEEDVELVMGQTGASEEDARAALDDCEGEVAEAIIKLIS